VPLAAVVSARNAPTGRRRGTCVWVPHGTGSVRKRTFG
jgi:hypothetical protein